MHREVMSAKEGEILDHIDLDKLNNQKANLRNATYSQNAVNRLPPRSNKSGFKGVCFDKVRKKFKSSVKVDGKLIYLGYFKDRTDAARAYNEAAVKYHGEFAKLNQL